MRQSFHALLFVVTGIVFVLCGYMWQSLRDERAIYLRRVSELQTQVYEMRGRLETLERIGVSIDLRDHTGIWFVTDVRGVER